MSEDSTPTKRNPEYGPRSPEFGMSGSGESNDSKKDTKDSKDSKDSKKSSSKSESKTGSSSDKQQNTKEQRQESRRAERSERRASFFKDDAKKEEGVSAKDTDTEKLSETPEHEGPIDVVERAKQQAAERQQSDDEREDPLLEQHFDEAEELSEQEVHDAVDGLIESKTHDIAHELSDVEEGSVEEFEALADAAFLEAVRERVDGKEDMSEDVLDKALLDALDDLAIDVTDEDIIEADESIEDLVEHIDGEEFFDDSVSIDSPESDDEDGVTGGSSMPPTPPTPPTPPVPPRPPVPPLPPLPPSPPAPPNPFNSPPVPPNPGLNHNAAPGPVINYTYVDRIRRRRRRRHLLTGALLGYVVGRRGGRKRTEKRLEPKIDKLEKEVTKLHDAVVNREEKIRVIARKAALTTEKEKVSEKKSVLKERRATRKEIRKIIEHRDEIAHTKKETLAGLGKMNLQSAEVFHEKRVYKELSIDGREIPRKSVETMTKDELLIVVGDLEYEGVKIRDMVAGGRLEVKALREITKQYIRGEKTGASERFEKTLLRELKPDPKELDNKRTIVDKLHLDHPIARAGEHMKDLMPTHLLPDSMKQVLPDRFNAHLETDTGRKKRKKSVNPLMPVWIVVIVTVVVIAVFIYLNAN